MNQLPLSILIGIIGTISAQQFTLTNQNLQSDYTRSLNFTGVYSYTENGDTVTITAQTLINNNGTYSVCQQTISYGDWTCEAAISVSANTNYDASISYTKGQRAILIVIGDETSGNTKVRSFGWNGQHWLDSKKLGSTNGWKTLGMAIGIFCSVLIVIVIVVMIDRRTDCFTKIDEYVVKRGWR